MRLKSIAFYFIFILLLSGCSGDTVKKTRLSLQVYAAPTEKIYLNKLPYIDEKTIVIDSAIGKGVTDSIIFEVPLESDRLYEIFIKSSGNKFYFIADAPYIHIMANNITGKFKVAGSPATASLLRFNTRRNEIIAHAQKMKSRADSLLKSAHPDKHLLDSLNKGFGDSLAFVEQRNRDYADTVQNAAAYLATYNNIDFGEDRQQLKKLVFGGSQRFPTSQPVKNLTQEVMDMLSIYEQEYNVGQGLPAIQLPDINGNNFSTASLKGKYYLIDFWSTWCRQCALYDPYKEELKSKFPFSKFQLVSVALDDKPARWSAFLQQRKYDWLQLIDRKMWRGTAAKTLKFDSIPFNFLVSPEGIILAKAIAPDSLLPILAKTIR